MPSLPQSTPPSWEESDSIRETTLQLLDDPEDREAVRRAGRMLYDLAVVATREFGMTAADPSITRAQLRAVAADLHSSGGYLIRVIRRSAKECSLDESDERLARFAGKIGRRVHALAAAIEGRLA